MSRRMSCSMTVDAVRERRKTVTRRNHQAWTTLKPGQPLTLVEKAMGLKPGEKQVVLAEVEIVSNRLERLGALTADEIAAEGFDPTEWTCLQWATWWAHGHGWRPGRDYGPGTVFPDVSTILCRRIEWRYLDA